MIKEIFHKRRIGMIPIDSFGRLQEFEQQYPLYCIYIDDLMNPARTDAISEMKRGFDQAAGQDFHILFPMRKGLFDQPWDLHENYNVEAAQEVRDKFGIGSENLPLLLFPSVRDRESLLTIKLNDPSFQDVANKIRTVTEIAVNQKPTGDMTPEQYRANVVKHIRNAQNEELANSMALVFGGFVFLHYSPQLLEAALRILMGG